ncbi:MAG: hypothetical protein ABI330_03295, partial [Caldimonas sp.]
LALCVGLTGCSRISEALMPAAAKINAAYPPSAETQVAQDRVLTLLGDDAKAKDALRSRIEARMALRALTCAKDHQAQRLARRTRRVDLAMLHEHGFKTMLLWRSV